VVQIVRLRREVDVRRREGIRLERPGRRRLDVFVHYPAINAADYRSLEENQLVSFDVTWGSKGPHAENVTAQ
jgi:cold shock CspA family protein